MHAIVMGYFNSLMGEGSAAKMVGPLGLGKRNERRQEAHQLRQATRGSRK